MNGFKYNFGGDISVFIIFSLIIWQRYR